MNAESGFFEFEREEYEATAATGDSYADAEGANASMNGWLVPIRSQKYSERIEQKLFSWLLLAEETRDLRADDLSGAMLLMDAVDYENLVITIRMSAHALTCLRCVRLASVEKIELYLWCAHSNASGGHATAGLRVHSSNGHDCN